MTSRGRPRICVVGSSIIDLVAYAPRLPKVGETIPGSRFVTGFGGKGANQAVMAALLGADVTMVAKIGSDTFGDDYLQNFAERAIDTTYVSRSTTASTGVAPIWVDESTGANSIIVVLGANDELSPVDVRAAAPAIEGSGVVVGQWEVPIESVTEAFRIARAAGVTTVFNPAPARGAMPDDLWSLIDIFCPNESETELLTGAPVATNAEATVAARSLLHRGVGCVVMTLGERGAIVVDDDRVAAFAAPSVTPVDTTGAGDAFVGTLAVMIAAGNAIDDAVRVAVELASASVQMPGTQTSYTDRRADPPW